MPEATDAMVHPLASPLVSPLVSQLVVPLVGDATHHHGGDVVDTKCELPRQGDSETQNRLLSIGKQGFLPVLWLDGE